MAVARSTRTRRGVRKARSSRKAKPSAPAAQTTTTGVTDTLPGWTELAKANQRHSGTGRRGTFLERIPTTRFALLTLAIALVFTMYVGHVHATQDLLADLQQLRRDNLQLHLKYNRLKGEFDQMIGPSVIYDRARALDLEEDVVYGATIEIEE